MHLKTTRTSTLRRSLTAQVRDELDLLPSVTNEGSGKFTLARAYEEQLTTWMLSNLKTTWVVHESPHDVEEPIVRTVLPPLNDRFAHCGGYYQAMSELRGASREDR